MFATYTMFGVEIKGEGITPTAIRLAYKRFEGAVVPVDASAKDDVKAHSVLAGIQAEQDLWVVRINQVFATGEAARIAATTEVAAAKAKTTGPIGSALSAVRREGGTAP